MLKLVTQVLSATWLIWLYANTPLSSIAGLTSPQQAPLTATLQPLRTELSALKLVPQWVQPLVAADAAQDPYEVRLEVHLRRRRVLLYQGSTQIRDYPIAIGQMGWETPTGQFRVMQMLENPDWIHPLTNKFVPNESLENPLGRYWIGFWTDGKNWVGFHGTPRPDSVGQASSHGCLRMRDADIDELYYQISTGTPVTVKP